MKIAMFLLAVFCFGCAGLARTPEPVDAYQYGDENKTCEELQTDIEAVTTAIADLKNWPKTKIASNIGIGVVGVMFPPFLLGLDLSDTDNIEINALLNRRKSLNKIAEDKKCLN